MKNAKPNTKKAPPRPKTAVDAFGNEVKAGDKVLWMNPISNSMELSTVKSVVNKAAVRVYLCVDEDGRPTEDACGGMSKGVASRKVCGGARGFPKRNPRPSAA